MPPVRKTTTHYGERIGRQGELRLGCSACLFDENGQVLLTRRKDNDLWCLPGGRVEAGESVSEACEREFWEETGLRVRVQRLVGVYSNPHRLVEYPDGNKAHIVSLHFVVDKLEGQPALSDETTEIRYFDVQALGGLDFLSDHRDRIFDSLAAQQQVVLK